jgi:DNA-binding MarR family transcriptional regulator
MYDSPDEPICRLIYFTAQELGNLADKVLKPYHLTLEQLHLLKGMLDSSGMTQKEIGASANKTPANVTRILDRLEKKNLVVRRRNPEDRRSFLVFITEGGRTLIDQVIAVFESFSSQILTGVSDEEEQLIRSSMEKISENLQRINP